MRSKRSGHDWVTEVTDSVVQGALVVKNTFANVGDAGDQGSIPGSGRSPGGRHSNPLQYSCLENPLDRGALWATVHGVAESWTWLKWLNIHAYKELQFPKFLCPWDFLGKNTLVGCHFFLQGIFSTEESNLSLLNWQVASLPLNHQESPILL